MNASFMNKKENKKDKAYVISPLRITKKITFEQINASFMNKKNKKGKALVSFSPQHSNKSLLFMNKKANKKALVIFPIRITMNQFYL